MSTILCKLSKGVTVTRYWGGAEDGTCIQITGNNGYVNFGGKDVKKLIDVLTEQVNGENGNR